MKIIHRFQQLLNMYYLLNKAGTLYLGDVIKNNDVVRRNGNFAWILFNHYEPKHPAIMVILWHLSTAYAS